jgi:preprotein translocase subunit SecE
MSDESILIMASPQLEDQPKAPRVSPAQFVRNVKGEAAKVVWPTRKETTGTTIIVFILVIVAAVFFFVVDQVLSHAIRALLGLGQ